MLSSKCFLAEYVSYVYCVKNVILFYPIPYHGFVRFTFHGVAFSNIVFGEKGGKLIKIQLLYQVLECEYAVRGEIVNLAQVIELLWIIGIYVCEH